ncbi:MAG: hypothetical protein ACE5G1_17730 [bacterium]
MNAHLKWILFTCFLSTHTICFWNEVFPQTHSTKPDSTRASELFDKARIFRREAQHDSADFYFEKAKAIYERIEDWINYLKCCNQMGEQLWQRSPRQRAIDYLENNVLKRFVDKSVDQNLELEISESLTYIGLAHKFLERYETSLGFFQSSLRKKIKILGAARG